MFHTFSGRTGSCWSDSGIRNILKHIYNLVYIHITAFCISILYTRLSSLFSLGTYLSTLSLLFRDLGKAVSFRRPPVDAPVHCFLRTSTFNSLDMSFVFGRRLVKPLCRSICFSIVLSHVSLVSYSIQNFRTVTAKSHPFPSTFARIYMSWRPFLMFMPSYSLATDADHPYRPLHISSQIYSLT